MAVIVCTVILCTRVQVTVLLREDAQMFITRDVPRTRMASSATVAMERKTVMMIGWILYQ